MEVWEKSCIQRNLNELINKTICNTTFISILQAKGILSDNDVASLEVKYTSEGRFSQSKLLFELLLTRKYGFDSLFEALQETRQTGSLGILNQAAIEELKQVADLIPVLLSKQSDPQPLDDLFSSKIVDALRLHQRPSLNEISLGAETGNCLQMLQNLISNHTLFSDGEGKIVHAVLKNLHSFTNIENFELEPEYPCRISKNPSNFQRPLRNIFGCCARFRPGNRKRILHVAVVLVFTSLGFMLGMLAFKLLICDGDNNLDSDSCNVTSATTENPSIELNPSDIKYDGRVESFTKYESFIKNVSSKGKCNIDIANTIQYNWGKNFVLSKPEYVNGLQLRPFPFCLNVVLRILSQTAKTLQTLDLELVSDDRRCLNSNSLMPPRETSFTFTGLQKLYISNYDCTNPFDSSILSFGKLVGLNYHIGCEELNSNLTVATNLFKRICIQSQGTLTFLTIYWRTSVPSVVSFPGLFSELPVLSKVFYLVIKNATQKLIYLNETNFDMKKFRLVFPNLQNLWFSGISMSHLMYLEMCHSSSLEDIRLQIHLDGSEFSLLDVPTKARKLNLNLIFKTCDSKIPPILSRKPDLLRNTTINEYKVSSNCNILGYDTPITIL